MCVIEKTVFVCIFNILFFAFYLISASFSLKISLVASQNYLNIKKRKDYSKFYENNFIKSFVAPVTNLNKKGMPACTCPEQWILEHIEIVLE